jgi:hypothetical protein
MESAISEPIVKRPIKEITIEKIDELSKRPERFTVGLTLNYACRSEDLSWAFDMIA